MTPTILWFSAIHRHDLALAGGKGANLGEMASAGFPVPPGFVITTAAYDAFVQANDLQPRIAALHGAIQPDQPGSLEAAGEQIRALFHQGQMPAGLHAEIIAAYEQLVSGAGAVAVRSSATAEDLPGASFAGQQDTYLNLTSEAATLEAVQRCWGSLWTDRAIAYRARQGIPPDAVSLAVVIQRLVPADAAGVLFTANPVSGKRTEMVINAAWGLGEAIVSGQVTPDQLVVDKASGRVVQTTIASKTVMTSRTPSGTVETPVPPERQNLPVLNPTQIHQLLDLGCRLEAHYGAPQDVEWAFAREALFVLQTRPITTLFPIPEPAPPAGDFRVYFNVNAAQGIAEPLTPLGLSIFEELFRRLRQAITGRPVAQDPRPTFLHPAAFRLYADVTDLLRNPLGRRLIRRAIVLVDPASRQTLDHLLAEPRLTPLSGAWPAPQTRRRLAQFALWLLGRLLRIWRQPAKASAAARRAIAIAMADWQRLANQAQTVADRLQLIEYLEQQVERLIGPTVFPMIASGMIPFFLLSQLLDRWLGDSQAVMTLARGIVGNPTTEMDLALWALAQSIRSDPASAAALTSEAPEQLVQHFRGGNLPARLQAGLTDFLTRYGHRGPREIDVGQPRWGDDPTHVLGILHGYLAQSDPELAADRHAAQGVQAAHATACAIQARLKHGPAGALKARVFAFAFDRYRLLAGWREYPKFCIVYILALQHRLLLGAGEQLAQAGVLAQPDDVFYLTLEELRALSGLSISQMGTSALTSGLSGTGIVSRPVSTASEGSTFSPSPVAPARTGDEKVLDAPSRGGEGLSTLATERRRQYQEELRRTRLPRLITSEGETFYGETLTGGQGTTLHGTGVSPGVIRGQVHVIRNPIGARLQPGEILVAPGTDPAWTPLFLTAGGLVMEMGGMMTHGAVVAREYGIPAVVGIPHVTEILHTGQWLQVDGASGIIQIEE